MRDDVIKQAVEQLGSHELQRALAILLLDSTVRVRDLLTSVQQHGEAAEWSKISHANEIAHTVAGFCFQTATGLGFQPTGWSNSSERQAAMG
jgi:hypothetical protein